MADNVAARYDMLRQLAETRDELIELQQRRDALIHTAVGFKVPVTDIASAAGLSRMQIYRITKSEDNMPNPFTGTHEGSLDVTSDFTLNGIVTGDMTVLNGAVLVGGVVHGNLTARGGIVTVRGIVGGPAREIGGTINVVVGSIVDGRVLNGDGRWITPDRTISYEVGPDAPHYRLSETV